MDASGHLPSKIGAALVNHGVPKDVDFLKIDVDSFDCEFLAEIFRAGYRPKAVDIESSPWWPPPLKFQTLYSDKHPYKLATSSALVGCSLAKVVDI